jgi:hypothetical protein
MTEEQAIKAVGSWPDKVELKTCGSDTTSGEWNCRILTFGDRSNNLTVFERLENEWIVNSWTVND